MIGTGREREGIKGCDRYWNGGVMEGIKGCDRYRKVRVMKV